MTGIDLDAVPGEPVGLPVQVARVLVVAGHERGDAQLPAELGRAASHSSTLMTATRGEHGKFHPGRATADDQQPTRPGRMSPRAVDLVRGVG